MLNLSINNYIEKMLKKVRYEYDAETKQWCAILSPLPGAYTQADSVEQARQTMAEVIEDYVIVSLQHGDPLPGFPARKRTKTAAYA